MEQRVGLFETIRWSGRCSRLSDHLDRMGRSADTLQIPFDRKRARRLVDDATCELDISLLHRVRLCLDPDGGIDAQCTRVDPDDLLIHSVAIYPEALPSSALWTRHKTTLRKVYESALEFARELGADEAIVLNERGEVMEGSYTNVWVMRGDRLITPPVEHTGGLPGIHRAEVLRRDPLAGTSVLMESDLHDSDSVFVANALRGIQRVAILDA